MIYMYLSLFNGISLGSNSSSPNLGDQDRTLDHHRMALLRDLQGVRMAILLGTSFFFTSVNL